MILCNCCLLNDLNYTVFQWKFVTKACHKMQKNITLKYSMILCNCCLLNDLNYTVFQWKLIHLKKKEASTSFFLIFKSFPGIHLKNLPANEAHIVRMT